MLIQYLVRDEQSTAAWQSGLETASGRPKPAMQSFTLPLVQVSRRGGTTTVWGQVAARRRVTSRTQLERFVAGSWAQVAEAQTTARGFLTRTVRAAHGDRLRLVDPSTGLDEPDARRHRSAAARETRARHV